MPSQRNSPSRGENPRRRRKRVRRNPQLQPKKFEATAMPPIDLGFSDVLGPVTPKFSSEPSFLKSNLLPWGLLMVGAGLVVAGIKSDLLSERFSEWLPSFEMESPADTATENGDSEKQ